MFSTYLDMPQNFLFASPGNFWTYVQTLIEDGMREIKAGKRVIGFIIDPADFPDGAHPATDSKWPLQLLLVRRKKGHVVPRHMHRRIPKLTRQPQEALVIVRGEARVLICDRKKKHIGTYVVKAGQCVFLADGGHEVTFTKNTLAYEFKTGPYLADKIAL